MKMKKSLLFISSCIAAIAVILGAFAAHSLKAKLAPEQLAVFETGVRYQVYHTFGLFILILLDGKITEKIKKLVSRLFIAGIVLFSGSLYLLSCKSILGIENWLFLGPITPIGGLCFITGWIVLAISSLKKQ